MEIRTILRGALAGGLAGVLAFAFSRIFAEPLINKAIDYESGRDDVLSAMNKAAGRTVAPDGPEIFSRSIQSTVGIATGLIAFSVGMGLLIAVAYTVMHGRFQVRPRNLVWGIAAFGFLGVFLLPYVKYPANPPAIGHTFTITTRGHLYLAMVCCSLLLLALAVHLARVLSRRYSMTTSVVLSAVAFLVLYGTLIELLPSLGHLSANVAAADQFGYGRAATETPQPIVNILTHALTVDGKTYQPGQIVYPGFDADVLWKFRWYSLLNQLLLWTTIALTFGALLERFLTGRPLLKRQQPTPPRTPEPAESPTPAPAA
ncbi:MULTISPECIES: CbtA family protein [Streptacidiphilus]|uniref:CbtA family protein n=1 Tax=Streptacidiphilus cavernicola TaxID=3342716 RepID=A0ABV6UX71_9ACTN|nr:CbtA family protein [Streptacidiphilus jeojiense]